MTRGAPAWSRASRSPETSLVTMKRLRTTACVTVFLSALASPALAQQVPPSAATPTPAPSAAAQVWEELTLGNGVQVLHGDIDAAAWTSNIDWLQQFHRTEVDLTVNSTLQRAVGHWSNTANANWVGRWARADLKVRRVYPMTHIWFQHDESAGVDVRFTAGAGLGAHVVSTKKVRFTVEGGLGHTTERVTDRDEAYVTVFLGPALRWTINERASITSHSLVYLNSGRRQDVRTNSEFDLNVQITKRVGLQNQVLLFHDNQPVAGHKPGNVQVSMNVAFSLAKGPVPQP